MKKVIIISVVLLCALSITALLAIEGRVRYRLYETTIARQSLYLMAGYTETLDGGLLDRARGINTSGSKVGLFKENQDVSFFWFRRHGEILHENTFHLNNVGLMSKYDYFIDRQPHEFRIVTIGDEMTGATTADVSWPDWLQEYLNEDESWLAKINRKKVTVINFGWPDAGFAHFSRVWKEKAKAFKPDLIIVNLNEGDFARYDAGARLSFRSREYKKSSDYRGGVVTYKSPSGHDAWLVTLCTGEENALRSRACTSGRPFALFLPKELAHNRKELAHVQDQVVSDFLASSMLWSTSLLYPLYPGILDKDILEEKNIKTEQMTPASNEELVAHARNNLRLIINDHPNVLIVQTPKWNDIIPSRAQYKMTGLLTRTDQSIKIIDARDWLPAGMSEQEIMSWYQVPYAGEKWSNKGHEVYARTIAGIVKERWPVLAVSSAHRSEKKS